MTTLTSNSRYQNVAKDEDAANTTALLFVDDRPCTLAEALFQRAEVYPVLLRFKQILHDLPDEYVARTSYLPTFIVDMERPLPEEVERFRVWQRQCGLPVKHFCNPSEPRQRISQHFARLLGLSALSEVQVDWLRHKLKMKEKLAQIGFRVATCAPIASRDDVLQFARQHGWPVIVKPAEGFACIDTYKLMRPADLDRLTLQPEREWLVEAFVPDKEYECCALIFGGQVLDTYLSYFPSPPLEATDGAINANISVRHVPPAFPVNMRTVVQRIVDGMALDHGYLHMELFVPPDGRYTVSEVALRLAGCEIPANHGLAYGFNIFDALIDIHMGRRPRLEYTQDRCVGDLLLPIKPGRITAITPLSELLTLEGVIGGKLKVAVGDVIPLRRASHFSSGYVHVEGATVSEVEDRMHRILERFAIATTPAAVDVTD